MSKSPVRVLVVARGQSTRVQAAWREIEPMLRARPEIDLISVSTTDDTELEVDGAELAIVLGGDGAILRACRQFGVNQIPVLGINLGRLGFLADLDPSELCARLPQIETRQFKVVPHLMFECEHHRPDGSTERHLGLNEVSLLAAASLSMTDVELSIDDQPVTTYTGDGVIISTPVGSTAHSLSAGGPILAQDLAVFVVTPICPHTLTNRPLVEHADRVYSLTAPHALPGVTLVIDGQIRTPFSPGDRAVVKRAPVTFQLARLPGHSYYAALHRKLGWSGQPHYQRLEAEP
jgi:NAD+ kinase